MITVDVSLLGMIAICFYALLRIVLSESVRPLAICIVLSAFVLFAYLGMLSKTELFGLAISV